MSAVSDILLTDANASLRRQLSERPQSELALMFGYWVAANPLPTEEINGIAASAAQRGGAQQDYQTVAVLGYASTCGLLDATAGLAITQGLERIAGRQPFVDGNPMAFCSDGVAILGIALGTRHLAIAAMTSKIVAWLQSFAVQMCRMEGMEEWQRCLFHAADQVLGEQIGIAACDSAAAADVQLALSVKGILPGLTGSPAEDQELAALKLVLTSSRATVSFEQAAIRLASLDWLSRSAPTAVPGRMSPEDLFRLLERFPAGLRNWTWETKERTSATPMRKWHVSHEYHVQNMLWFMLSPIFPDLDDEQYLTKIAQKNPRADLYIPSMKVIVEAKFLRTGDRMQKIIDEISSDASLYGALGNECKGIIPFIWDDSARSHEHDYLKQGLRKLSGVIGTVIVSRPSGWVETSSEEVTQQSRKKSAGKKASAKKGR